MRAAVTLHIDAPPDEIWGLVSDITKMGEYSPEVIKAEWIGGATGPAIGARYRGHVKRNENWPALYWTTCEITECVPGEVFEFAVMMGDRRVNTWRYEFHATEDGGTDVTESFDLGDNLFTKTNYDGLDPALPAANVFGPAGDIRDQYRGVDRGSYPSNRIFSVGIVTTF